MKGHIQVLKPLVNRWIVEHSETLDKYTDDDIEHMLSLMRKGTVRDRRVFSPSGATACARKQVISKHKEFKEDRTFDVRTIRIFLDGNWRHLKWQMIFFKMGIAESFEEFKSFGPLDYGGSIDLIVRLNMNKVATTKLGKKLRVILDVKGAHDNDWAYIRRTRKPHRAHYVQVQIYMMLHNIQYAIIWYENKNTNDVLEVIVEADYEFWDTLRQRQKNMKRFFELDAFPKEECDIDKNDFVHRSCPQREVCLKLPVHILTKRDEARKIADPRKKDKDFERWNQSPLKPLNGSRGERKRLSSK